MNRFFVMCATFAVLCLSTLPTKAQEYHALLGERETTYAYKGEKQNRAENIELAVSKINGVILQPGEMFSYNAVVGNRTITNGFKKAPVIISGELVEGIGGGVCQVSGTLHAAVLYSGLEIVESTQHSRMSTYIDPGLDSTVAWPTKDLKFRNNLPFAIKIVAHTSRTNKRGVLNIGIYAAKDLYYVEVISDIHYKSKIRTQIIKRDDLPKTYRKVEEVGTPTIRMTRYRKIYDVMTNELLLTEELKLNYDHSTRIIVIGTKEE